MESTVARVELEIVGRVQGVYYRATAVQVARRLGLLGWVRNESDGSVRAVAQGPRPDLDKFIIWCRQGPPAARVDSVRCRWPDTLATAGTLVGFNARY